VSSPVTVEVTADEAMAANRVREPLSAPVRLFATSAGPIAGAAALAHFGLSVRGVMYALFAAVLVVLAAIDFETRLRPNRIVLPSAGIVLAIQLARGPGDAREWLIAAAGAGAFFLVPALLTRGAIGMGDVKLAALMGVALGSHVVVALEIACLAVFPFALYILIRRGRAVARTTALPFGPFMVAGALIALFLI
jgi:leader peptidase (prepilin peptidase) / N-methyltransferase